MKFLYLIDDHDVLRIGVADWMRHNSDWKIAGQASYTQDALQLIESIETKKENVYVAVVDLSLKEPGSIDNTLGFTVLKAIKDSGKDIRSVVYTSFDSGFYVNKAMSDEYKALGYVSKNSSIHTLLDAINSAAEGQTYIQQELKRTVTETGTMLEALTKKERIVIDCIAQGLGNQEAAEKLGISIRTLENHLGHIYDKTDTHDKNSMLLKLGYVVADSTSQYTQEGV